MDIPLVTVLMAVYNGQKYLGETIESILSQSLKDFEFIIIDDASTDKSRILAEGFHDKRIRVVSNSKNLRLAGSLNRGIHLARGKYIARMDADDISLPLRLEKQTAFMEENPEIGISGTWLECFGDLSGVWDYPTEPAMIHAGLLFQNQLGHPTVIMRREWILGHRLFYDPDFLEAEDYKLWTRCARHFPLGNLGEVLLMYRWHDSQASQAHSNIQRKYHGLVCRDELRRLGVEASEDELALHLAISFLELAPEEGSLTACRQWLHRLWLANQISNHYQPDALMNVLDNRWHKINAVLGFSYGELFD
ncbi:MAG: glycosyltransferase family 2 protein [Deltaproteobacteria bacterium]